MFLLYMMLGFGKNRGRKYYIWCSLQCRFATEGPGTDCGYSTNKGKESHRRTGVQEHQKALSLPPVPCPENGRTGGYG
jgi:hypothetical protein